MFPIMIGLSEENGVKKGPWTPEEDRMLIDCIQKYGHRSWKELPKLAGLNRCGKSCRLRWTNYLRPDIKRGAFSDEEQHIIIDLHAKLGNKWSAIASYLPGRTDNEIKNFWNTHLKKRLIHNGIDPITHMPTTQLNPLLPIPPQFLGFANGTSSRNPSWEDVVRLIQADAAQLAKILLIGNILHELMNTGTCTPLPIEALNRNSEPAQATITNQPSKYYSSLMGLQLEGLCNNSSPVYDYTPINPDFNTLTFAPCLNSVPQHHLFNGDNNDKNTIETKNIFTGNSSESSVHPDYTVPDLVSASPGCLRTDQTNNNVISSNNLSNPSSTSTTFEALGDLMDDEASNYYWKQILDNQASLSP